MFNSSNVNAWLQANVHYPIIDHFLLITTKADLLAYPRPKDIKVYRNEAALITKAWRDADQISMKKFNRTKPSSRNATATIQEGELQTLVIESNSGNILVRAVQPNLLLVLVGEKSKSDDAVPVRFTPEAKGEARYPSGTPAIIDFSSPDWQEESEDPGQVIDHVGQTSPIENDNTQMQQTTEAIGTPNEDPSQVAEVSPGVLPGVPLFEHGIPAIESYMESSFSQEELDLGVLHLQRSKLDSMANWLASELDTRGFLMKED